MNMKKPKPTRKPKFFYAISAVVCKSEIETNTFGLKSRESILLTWADGMVGVLPVFSNKKKAKKYAGKRPILTFKEVK